MAPVVPRTQPKALAPGEEALPAAEGRFLGSGSSARIHGEISKDQWKDPPVFMGKLAISMAMFNSYVSHYQVTRG